MRYIRTMSIIWKTNFENRNWHSMVMKYMFISSSVCVIICVACEHVHIHFPFVILFRLLCTILASKYDINSCNKLILTYLKMMSEGSLPFIICVAEGAANVALAAVGLSASLRRICASASFVRFARRSRSSRLR